MKKRKATLPLKLNVDLTGDRRLAENVILEVRAAARRVGLEIANVDIVKQQPARPKIRKSARRSRG